MKDQNGSGYNHQSRSCDRRPFCGGLLINGRCPDCGWAEPAPLVEKQPAHCMRHAVEGVGEIARAALDKDAGQ